MSSSGGKKGNGALGESKNKYKQGSLFSFFSKQGPQKTAAAAATTPKATHGDQTSKPAEVSTVLHPVTVTKAKSQPSNRLSVGTRVAVYWNEDNEYYPAIVEKYRDDNHCFIKYEDGTAEWTDLDKTQYKIIPTKKKKQRIQEDDDDEEFEFGKDDASYDEPNAGLYTMDHDSEDDFIVSDEFATATKKRKSSMTGGAHVTMLSKQTPSARKTPTHVTPVLASMSAKQVTPCPSSSLLSTPLPFTEGIVNPPGAHLHNHLPFLRHPRDAQGRTTDHADYDPRTLKVVYADYERLNGGKKMTDAVAQWWELKAHYFDTLLLFKTGKFYEIFHMDADAAVQVCDGDLNYMKGIVAHCGFPEISYGQFSNRLVSAGYKVARVEQTETPAQLAERKRTHRGSGPKPKVVNREVCSILTRGTRTFCYLDDNRELEEEGGSGTGPLLAIREVLIDAGDGAPTNEDDEVKPVCEYGVTIVDAVRGSVTIGQFADDILRSRMTTLFMAFEPSEVLVQGGENGVSPMLMSLLEILQSSSSRMFHVETIRSQETFPKSTAIDKDIQRRLERSGNSVHPWQVKETLEEIHRRRYYPRASMKDDSFNVSRWPPVIRACVEGNAELALSSFGAVLFYLQRSLIDHELLSMGIVKAYIPPATSAGQDENDSPIARLAIASTRAESAVDETIGLSQTQDVQSIYRQTQLSQPPMDVDGYPNSFSEDEIDHLSLDGTTLKNLEILVNSVDLKPAGSLWWLINHTKAPHGARLLRAWLLRPLFRKAQIDRRTDAVEELVSGAAAFAFDESRSVLAKCGDIERLLSRVHSMSGMTSESDDAHASIHPSDRAVLYENVTYTKRKVADFSKLLNGLRSATRIPEIFQDIEIRSGLLTKIVTLHSKGGSFPDMENEVDWYFANFDCDKAAKGEFEPVRGIDALYDEACVEIERIESVLNDYKNHMCSNFLLPQSVAKASWTYVNTKPNSKDKYMIELPAHVQVPRDFLLKAKRGKGSNQVNKYQTSAVQQLVVELERAFEVQNKRRAKGMQMIFARFDAERHLWAAAAQATALLDALGSLAKTSSNAGYVRANILDCPVNGSASITVSQGRHPIVEKTLHTGEFVPNNLTLGGRAQDGSSPRVLLLSGVNMGGKSTCLRQTCLISILAQIGCFVPAEECSLTPVDRIYTRLGASDRILQGQSTFFVELAETAAALRGATRRSLVIMDELGRGTSTFDGTAIASASVKHLVERTKCLTLFATHYHSLLDDWKDHQGVRLGHMECVVENGQITTRTGEVANEGNVTFLYTLGEGGCPKSFGINVARLAGLPFEVLSNAQRISAEFERETNGNETSGPTGIVIAASKAADIKKRIDAAVSRDDNWDAIVFDTCKELQTEMKSI